MGGGGLVAMGGRGLNGDGRGLEACDWRRGLVGLELGERGASWSMTSMRLDAERRFRRARHRKGKQVAPVT